MLDQILKCWAIEFGQNTELSVKHLLPECSAAWRAVRGIIAKQSTTRFGKLDEAPSY
jgi:hypothetical protein